MTAFRVWLASPPIGLSGQPLKLKLWLAATFPCQAAVSCASSFVLLSTSIVSQLPFVATYRYFLEGFYDLTDEKHVPAKLVDI